MKKEETKYKDYKVYNIRFSNLTDLYDYLKEDPKRNATIFYSPASLKEDSFYGKSLNKSIEYLISGYTSGFDNFLNTSSDLKKIGIEETDKYEIVRSIHGGVPLASLVAMGVPDCMLSSRVDVEAKAVNIHFNLGYPAYTKEQQIINRGLATLYIIQALEAKGYIVNFNAFQLSKVKDEIIHMVVTLKKQSDLFLDIQKCYFPIRAKEFFRRVLFRVMESSDVRYLSWGESYGHTLGEEEVRDFYNSRKEDLIISSPGDMGLRGENIYEDTLTMIETLGIESEFDVKSLRNKIRR